MEITKTVSVITNNAKTYACSLIGILHISALNSSLIAFICNESATWCTGRSFCVPQVYESTYIYFSVMTLASFLTSGVFYILHCTAIYEKLPCSSKRKLYAELVCLSGVIFFLIFGNLFMISRTGNRIIYMVSTFFGCLAMSIFGVQLILVFLQNYSLLIVEEHEDSDDVESNPKGSAQELSIQVKGIKRFNIAGHSPGNKSHNRKGSHASSEICPYTAGNESTDSASSSEEENVPS